MYLFWALKFWTQQMYGVKDGNEGVEIHEAASINSKENK